MATPIQDKNKNSIVPIDFENNETSHLGTSAKFTVRLTPDDKVSILDVIEVITKQKRDACRIIWQRYQKDNPELPTARSYFKFRGRGQRDTPVTDIRMILEIIMNLPGKMAGHYRKKFAHILVGVFGGDRQLHDVIEANAMSTLPAAQFFQRAVVRHNSDEIRDAEWFRHRQQLNKPAHVRMALETNNKYFEIQKAIENCTAIHGVPPKEYRELCGEGVNKNKLKDHYPKEQMLISTAFLGAVKNINGSVTELKRISGLFGTLCKELGFHEEPQILASIEEEERQLFKYDG